jgi:hypothetical protein
MLDETSLTDERVECRGCGVGLAEERLAVELADDPSVGLDNRIRPDHLQVESEPTRLDRVQHVAQDVHDVLRVDASE